MAQYLAVDFPNGLSLPSGISTMMPARRPTASQATDIGVVRDNASQLKFKAESTGFEK
jgi:hypothetical protein